MAETLLLANCRFDYCPNWDFRRNCQDFQKCCVVFCRWDCKISRYFSSVSVRETHKVLKAQMLQMRWDCFLTIFFCLKRTITVLWLYTWDKKMAKKLSHLICSIWPIIIDVHRVQTNDPRLLNSLGQIICKDKLRHWLITSFIFSHPIICKNCHLFFLFPQK